MTDSPCYLKFLGTAGARYVMASQMRSSAGLYVQTETARLLVDPGPGTLVRLAHARPRLDAAAIDVLLLTHRHLDHSSDANVILDAVTAGGTARRGWLCAPADAFGPEPVVFEFLRSSLTGISVLESSQEYAVQGMTFRTSGPHRHGVETYGVIFTLGGRQVAILPDTAYFEGLTDAYAGTDTLVLHVLRPETSIGTSIMHLGVPEAARVIEEVRPRQVILTHFGISMIKAGPPKVAARLADQTGIAVTAAYDGMRWPLGPETGN